MMNSKLLTTTAILMSAALMFSCNRHQIKLRKIQSTQNQIKAQDSTMALKQANGLDFEATGNIPTPWTLHINFDQAILFESNDGIRVSAKPAIPVLINSSEKITSKPGEKPIEIIVSDLPCDNNTTSNNTLVSHNGIEYKGCGKYLLDVRLHNKWELEAIDDVAVNATTFPNGMPFLNFNLPNKSISGYDGCNGFGGNFTVMGKRIRFHALSSTLRACIQHAAVEFKLQLLSNNLVDYHFEMDKLILYLSDDSRMQYKPVYK